MFCPKSSYLMHMLSRMKAKRRRIMDWNEGLVGELVSPKRRVEHWRRSESSSGKEGGTASLQRVIYNIRHLEHWNLNVREWARSRPSRQGHSGFLIFYTGGKSKHESYRCTEDRSSSVMEAAISCYNKRILHSLYTILCTCQRHRGRTPWCQTSSSA